MKAKIKLIIFLVFVLIVNITSAQQTVIKGKVTDTKSGESMVGVHITLKEAVHGTITGSDGTFVLRPGFNAPWNTCFICRICAVGYCSDQYLCST